jgi:hypothetical protein
VRAANLYAGADEVLKQQDSIPDREITSPVQKGTQHTHPLGGFLFDLIDVRRQVEPCIRGQPQKTCCVEPLD